MIDDFNLVHVYSVNLPSKNYERTCPEEMKGSNEPRGRTSSVHASPLALEQARTLIFFDILYQAGTQIWTN